VPEGPLVLPVEVKFADARLSGTLVDQDLRLAGKTVKLSQIRSLWGSGFGPKSQAVLNDGKILQGNLSDLPVVPVHLGGQSIRANLGRAVEVNVESPAQTDSVSCTILATQSGTEVGRLRVPMNIEGTFGVIHLELGGGVTMDLVLIRPGSFMMGQCPKYTWADDDPRPKPIARYMRQDYGERPGHKVTIAEHFYMGRTEVTIAQWEAVMGTNPPPSQEPGQRPPPPGTRWDGTRFVPIPPAKYRGSGKQPVCGVSWEDCQTFCRKLSEKAGGGRQFRLPTEAEWEYACRAGSTTTFCYGDDSGRLGEYAWYRANSNVQSHPVAQKKPNAWGLYDMHGNVVERCSDLYREERRPADPPWTERTSRGGSWGSPPVGCRTVARGAINPNYTQSTGLRVVCEASVGPGSAQ
jgi:formylglycine-generating enzyme required for sulfatase activity